jgi:hypothetical protein
MMHTCSIELLTADVQEKGSRHFCVFQYNSRRFESRWWTSQMFLGEFKITGILHRFEQQLLHKCLSKTVNKRQQAYKTYTTVSCTAVYNYIL